MSQYAINRFQEYLRIKTDGPDADYASAIAFLTNYLESDLNVNVQTLTLPSGYPVLWTIVKGSEPSLPALLLNSHMDVVPVELEKWSSDPWAAHIDAEGYIVARGTQDMKSVGIQYIEAMKKLRGRRLRRNVVLLFVPFEELGGSKGMCQFLKTKEFAALNVGCALDEGLANPNENEFSLFYGERTPFWVRVDATGAVGHGSRFVNDTAAVKLFQVCNKFLAFREQQQALLEHSDGCKTLGDVTTLNLTNIHGGVGPINVIPGSMHACFDIRIAVDVDLDEFKRQLDEWCDLPGVSYTLLQSMESHHVSKLDGPWGSVLMDTFKQLGKTVVPAIFPAATDSRFLRQLGTIPAFGFSPMHNTPILLHDHNEKLHKDVFLEGIDIFVAIIEAMANNPSIEK